MKKNEIKKQIKKEAIITLVMYAAYFIWWYSFAYGMGDKDPSSYNYILGLPEWFFYSCILGFIVFSATVFFVIKIFFKEIPLEEEK